ncbi:MAG: hypothetical protein C9356_10050 [Oleiphilus sp.]|nr:MAG: hypothetical protein C9356_10050 [Oleiphilus sp.]
MTGSNGDGSPPPNSDHTSNKLIKNIGLATAALVGIAAMINSAGDVFDAVSGLPIGDSERIFEKKSHEHFREAPIFEHEIEIPAEGSKKSLGIYVYSNADIFVNYSGVKQWLPADPESVAVTVPLFFSAAYAWDPVAEIVSAPKAILKNLELEEAKSLSEIESRKEQKTNELDAVIEREYWFEEMKDDHPNFFQSSTQSYQFEVKAVPGYKIVQYTIVPVSHANGEVLMHQLSPNGDAIVVKLELSSGPKIDQWRGWFKGKIVTNQEAIAE